MNNKEKGDRVKLEDVPEVIIDVRVADSYKYIVAAVTDGSDTKIVVRGDRAYGLHYDILTALRYEIGGLRVQCIGGGKITINPDTRMLELRGYSGNYGKEPDREQTVDIIHRAYPDFTIAWS